MNTRGRTKPTSRKSLANEVLAVVLVAAAILLLLSLVTYDSGDLSWNSVGPTHEPRNLIGVVGAHLAEFFLQLFGLASFSVPVLFGLIAIRAFFNETSRLPIRKICGAGLLLFALSGFLSLFPSVKLGVLIRSYNGGAVGRLLEEALAGFMGTAGAAIVLIVASVLTLMLTMEISLVRTSSLVRRLRKQRLETQQLDSPEPGYGLFARARDWITQRSQERRLEATRRTAEYGADVSEDSERTSPGAPETLRRRDRIWPIWKSETAPGSVDSISVEPDFSVDPSIVTAPAASGAQGQPALETATPFSKNPEISPIRKQAAEALRAYAAKTDQLKTGRAGGADVTRDPDVAEMTSTLWIDRSSGTEHTAAAVAKEKPARKKSAVETSGGRVYQLPSLELLEMPIGHHEEAEDELRQRATILAEKCKEFSVVGHIHRINPGPVVTTFEFKPDPGIKYSRVVGLADDLCLALKAESIRIDRIPGKSTVGIEVPNAHREKIFVREIIESPRFQQSTSKLTVALGKTINGEEYIADLTKMPHLLIAGATGAGKSVTLNAIICSILCKASPDEVKFIMVDPKRVELGLYEGVPHLLTPIVIDPKRAANALKWAVNEMESRYRQLAELGVRNIEQYNRQLREADHPTLFEPDTPRPLPYIVIAIDELADLMMVARGEVETSIARLAQMARAVGIHLVLATQRPSVDIITGVIKANIPSRIAFRVSSKVDSRTIIDSNGAEGLLGQGDMLFLPPGTARLVRVHGSFVNEVEVKAITDHTRKQAEPQYNEQVTLSDQESPDADGFEGEQDDLYDEALAIVTDMGRASTSVLQRRLSIGYGRAAKILDMMERQGFIGPAEGSKPRKVLQGAYEFRERLQQRIDETDLD
ncbi:MAG TPA: DNA translocase FtsK [Blastocatellia bacterium]|nr:DNA translocase FtsK [Blastocatellia bacterium]